MELINVKPEIGKKSGLLNEEVLVPIKKLEIQSVRSICPEGRRCDEYGSIVKVSGPIGDGCDREGPSGYNVKKNLDGSVQLNVIAYKFANNELRACPKILKTFQKEIFLPMTFVDINHVKLNVLK